METFVGTVFIIVCVLLIIVVLLQKGRGGGLGAAFGGAGSSAFGTRTGDVFTWITIVLTGLFLLLAIGATLLYRPGKGKVLEPRLDPMSGTAIPAEGQEIEIRCDTNGARIAHTTDGSPPIEKNAESSQYVTVFVKPGQTLKVQAFADKRRPSDMIVASYERQEATAPPVPKTQPTTTKPATTKPATTKPATTKPATTRPAGGS